MTMTFDPGHYRIYRWQCSHCGAVGHDHDFDEYGECLHCNHTAEREPYDDRLPYYISVAGYERTRAFGGSEEGGWWFNTGCLIDESLRCFPQCDFPQIQSYIEMLERRYRDEYRGDGIDRPVFEIHIYADRVAPTYFPDEKPRWS